MTSITLTTVGYGEILKPFGAWERLFTMGLMWSGMGVTLYALVRGAAFQPGAETQNGNAHQRS